MIRVFFETDGYSELAAVFVDERTYINCLPALEIMAQNQCFKRVTEYEENSIASSKIFNLLKSTDYLPNI